MIIHKISLICDYCGRVHSENNLHTANAVRKAAAHSTGWVRTQAHGATIDLCPHCRSKDSHGAFRRHRVKTKINIQ